MVSQGNSPPGPTLEKFLSEKKEIFRMSEWGFEPRPFRAAVRTLPFALSLHVWEVAIEMSSFILVKKVK